MREKIKIKKPFGAVSAVWQETRKRIESRFRWKYIQAKKRFILQIHKITFQPPEKNVPEKNAPEKIVL